jgi:hypothetical protein
VLWKGAALHAVGTNTGDSNPWRQRWCFDSAESILWLTQLACFYPGFVEGSIVVNQNLSEVIRMLTA